MCESKLKLHVVLIVLCLAFKSIHGVDDSEYYNCAFNREVTTL